MATEQRERTRTQETKARRTIYVTLTGLPLSIDFKWPVGKSGAGADF